MIDIRNLGSETINAIAAQTIAIYTESGLEGLPVFELFALLIFAVDEYRLNVIFPTGFPVLHFIVARSLNHLGTQQFIGLHPLAVGRIEEGSVHREVELGGTGEVLETHRLLHAVVDIVGQALIGEKEVETLLLHRASADKFLVGLDEDEDIVPLLKPSLERLGQIGVVVVAFRHRGFVIFTVGEENALCVAVGDALGRRFEVGKGHVFDGAQQRVGRIGGVRLDVLALDGKILLGTGRERRFESLEKARMLSLCDAVRIIDIEGQSVGVELFVLLFEIEFVEFSELVGAFRRRRTATAARQTANADQRTDTDQQSEDQVSDFHIVKRCFYYRSGEVCCRARVSRQHAAGVTVNGERAVQLPKSVHCRLGGRRQQIAVPERGRGSAVEDKQ